MTISLESRSRAEDILEAVHEVVPDIRARASETESARRVPLDLLDRLKATGCFGLLLPESHGGTGSDLAGAMPVFEQLSRADASVGWITLIGGNGWIDLAGLPRSTFDAIYAPGSPTVVAGVFNPTGTAAPVPGGYRVNGRWSFASGCEHADWIFGNCIDTSSSEPELRIAVFRPDEVTIEDTWSVVGLCGTGSHHFNVRDVTVPAERTLRVFTDPPSVDSPLTSVPAPAIFSLLLATVPLGLARGALDDVLELAADKVPLLSESTLATNPLFQHQIAQADVSLHTAHALLYEAAEETWATAVAGDELTPQRRARLHAAPVHATVAATSAVEACYRAGGGSSIYLESPLQRRMRDVQALSQHFLLKPDVLTTCGAVLAGQEPDLTIF